MQWCEGITLEPEMGIPIKTPYGPASPRHKIVGVEVFDEQGLAVGRGIKTRGGQKCGGVITEIPFIAEDTVKAGAGDQFAAQGPVILKGTPEQDIVVVLPGGGLAYRGRSGNQFFSSGDVTAIKTPENPIGGVLFVVQ